MSGRSTFDELKHPRDKHGRFTKSRTVKATAKDKTLAKSVAAAFSPSQDASGTGGQAYLQKIAGGKGNSPGQEFSALGDVNTALRAGNEHTPGVAAFDKSAITLPDDVLLSRRVPVSEFGATDPQALQGMKVRDAGFAPAQLGTVPAEADTVRMHMAVPAGTKAVINPATGEVVLDRDTEMVVSHVETNAAGGHDMYLTVLPKSGVKPGFGKAPEKAEPKADTLKIAPKADGANKQAKQPPLEARPAAKPAEKTAPKPHAEAEKPHGEAQVRADLMKLKVPELQAQMRERGLKSGGKRKSELVDALVADETGRNAGPAGPKTEPAKTPSVKAPTLTNSETSDGNRSGGLEAGIASGVKERKPLSNGAVGDVELVIFNDGSKAVRKVATKEFARISPEELTDREHLAGRIGAALGIPIPKVVKTGDREVFMEYVDDAKPALSKLRRVKSADRDAAIQPYVDSDDGRKLGLFDLLVANDDRHLGNWMIRSDGSLVGIDHGLSWPSTPTSPEGRVDRPPVFDSPFAQRFNTGLNNFRETWKVNDLSQADISWIGSQLRGLRDEFDQAGRGDWLDYSLFRLKQLSDWADGDVNRIKP